jgi:hypothetical protein
MAGSVDARRNTLRKSSLCVPIIGAFDASERLAKDSLGQRHAPPRGPDQTTPPTTRADALSALELGAW